MLAALRARRSQLEQTSYYSSCLWKQYHLVALLFIFKWRGSCCHSFFLLIFFVNNFGVFQSRQRKMSNILFYTRLSHFARGLRHQTKSLISFYTTISAMDQCFHKWEPLLFVHEHDDRYARASHIHRQRIAHSWCQFHTLPLIDSFIEVNVKISAAMHDKTKAGKRKWQARVEIDL